MPDEAERAGVLKATLRSYGRAGSPVDVEQVAKACAGFTGAELATLIPDAMFVAFGDAERDLRTSDLINAAKSVVPLAKTASEKIDRLRRWAAGRARPASSAEEEFAS